MDLKYKVMKGEMDLVELGGKKSLTFCTFPFTLAHTRVRTHTQIEKEYGGL